MDYSLSEAQRDLVQLAADVFGRLSGSAYSAADGVLHADPRWQSIGGSGLIGIASRELSGGAGLGALEAALVAEQCGRACVTHPVSAAMAGAVALDLLDAPGVADEMRTAAAVGALVAMLPVDSEGTDPSHPRSVLDLADGRLRGPDVVAEAGADLLVLPVSFDRGRPAIVLVETAAVDILATPMRTAGGALVRYHLDGHAVDAGDTAAGEEIGRIWARLRALREIATCAELCGLAAAALELTAEYAGNRVQFGRPIGTFQAVANRLGDGYIDVESMTWSTRRAADSLDRNHVPDRAVAVARVIACEAADRVLAAAQHIHGGLGVDVDYPLHAFYLRVRQLLVTAGGAQRNLSDLGDLIAAGLR